MCFLMEDGMATLSLADVARIAGVERPVVSMWRRRVKHGRSFPQPTSDGRFPSDEILDYLNDTGRGNNPEARRDAALAVALARHGEATLGNLLILLAVKAVTDATLGEIEPEVLLDLVDELDPDDDWLFSELEDVDIDDLASQADDLADAAWSSADAYEALLRHLTAGVPSLAPGQELATMLASLARSIRSDRGAVVDVAGSATDVVIKLGRLDEAADVPVVLAADEGARAARRRYEVHGIRPRRTPVGEDWALPDGSVLLAALPGDPGAAFDLLAEIAVQLGGQSIALVVGPSSVLIDALPSPLESQRDRFLRGPQRLLAAAARLPQGLTRAGGREHLALWLLQPNAPEVVRVADLGGVPVTKALGQDLLDDLFAVAFRGQRPRAFALLHPTRAADLITRRGSLVDHQVAVEDVVPSAGDDAARIQQLLAALREPPSDAFADLKPLVRGNVPGQSMTLGQALRRRQVHVHPGTRLASLPAGTTPLWTAGALAQRRPESINLLAFAAAHPTAQLTHAGDVVFTTDGQPHALVDNAGGAVVAYPVRAIRVQPGQPFSPHAIAAAINAVAPGNNKFRTWLIPVVAGSVADADDVLARVDALATELRDRQTQVDELRRLVVRSVLPGAVAFRETLPNDAKGA